MLCDKCLKNQATVHMTTFVNGQVKTMHLCAGCAAARKKSSSVVGPNFNDFMSSFYETDETTKLVCENCGTTLDEFSQSGRLGCAQCYSVFRESIIPVLNGIHMNTQHKGKKPGQRVKLNVKNETVKNKTDILKSELKTAVATENFEEAARLRDEIALLKKEAENNA